MSLSHHHQIELLKDIMVNHMEDCCGSVSECEQLGRLVKSLLVSGKVPEEMEPLLGEIYEYCQAGQNSRELDHHINAHQEQLSRWVGQIDSYS